jgi:hypothetical protein
MPRLVTSCTSYTVIPTASRGCFQTRNQGPTDCNRVRVPRDGLNQYGCYVVGLITTATGKRIFKDTVIITIIIGARGSWLRHHVTSWRVLGSIPDEVNGYFNCLIPLAALWPWDRLSLQGWQPHRHLWADCLGNVRASKFHKPMGLHGLLQGYIYAFFFTFTLHSC